SLFRQRDTGLGSIEARQGAAERLAQLFERGTADEELRRAQGHGIEHTLTQPPALEQNSAPSRSLLDETNRTLRPGPRRRRPRRRRDVDLRQLPVQEGGREVSLLAGCRLARRRAAGVRAHHGF